MKLQVTAPTRVSLFGGSTDVEPYASKHGGVCINLAIDIYQKFVFDTESKKRTYIKGGHPKFYKAFFDEFNYEGGVKQSFDNKVHSGTGSSASAAVALVAGLSKLAGKELARDEIAEKAWDIEVNKLGMYGGKQDQYAAVYGGLNEIRFRQHGVSVYPLFREFAEVLEEGLLLFDTNKTRDVPDLQNNLKDLTDKRKDALDRIKKITKQAYHYIISKDLKSIGRLLDEGWQEKKKTNKVTNKKIDNLYDTAIKAGALGGKLCGAGGGGYMVFAVERQNQESVKKAMKKKGADWVDFNVDYNGIMTRFI